MVSLSVTDATGSSHSGVKSTVHRSVDGIDANQLNNLVVQSDAGTLFHRYEWLATVEDATDWEPRHILVTKSGNPVGFLPNFATALPLPDMTPERVADALPLEIVGPPPPGFGGPLLTRRRRETLALLFDRAALAERFRTVFHRVETFDTDVVGYGRYLESLGYRPRVTKCTFFLDLRDDWEDIRDDMDSGRRRGLRNALDQDYEVDVLGLEEGLDRTYEQYVANMERVDGRVHSRQFFEALAERLPDRVRVFRATVDGVEVGRYVHLLDDENGVLHHWLSAIGDSDAFEYHPSDLLHQRAIRWGCEREYDRYSFGPTKPHFSDSVYRFKEKYGGKPIPSLCWERGTLPVAWHAYDLARSWYRRSQVDVR